MRAAESACSLRERCCVRLGKGRSPVAGRITEPTASITPFDANPEGDASPARSW